MAIARVQEVAKGGNSASATTAVLTLGVGISTTVGNHLILTAAASNTPTGVTGVTDSKGNTWVIDFQRVTDAAGNNGSVIASTKLATALVAGDTITITTAANSRTAGYVYEYSGLATSSWFDTGHGGGDAGVAGTAADSGLTSTTASADSLLISAISVGSAFTAFTMESLSPAWTLEGSGASTGTIRTIEHADRIVSSTGTYQAKATWTTSRDWSAAIGVYKAAAGGGGGVTGTGALAQVAGVLAATGKERFIGSTALTQAAGVLASSGKERFTGAAAMTQAAGADASSGKERFRGPAALSQVAGVLASTGRLAYKAAIAVLQAAGVLSASGHVGSAPPPVSGLIQAPPVIAGTGQMRFWATFARRRVFFLGIPTETPEQLYQRIWGDLPPESHRDVN